MKAKLILQEGPGAGRSYPLDPAKQLLLSVGRSGDCNVVLQDHRASRYHADIRWTGERWEVTDRGSTNGTYVNGLRVNQPYDLRLGDRITIGETTLVMREWGTLPPAPIPGPQREPLTPRAQPHAHPKSASGGATAAFWLAQGFVVVAIVCLASGAFLPWLEVSGSLSPEMQPLVQGITNLVSSILGPDFLFVTQRISGMEGYGKLTLGLAAIATFALVVDLFFYRKSVVAGVVYLLGGLLALGAMAADLKNLLDIYNQVQSASLLFGIKLSQVVEFFDNFVNLKVTPLPGLYLTGAGLLVLVVGGVARLAVALFNRQGSR
jgi:hypothetical protein